MALLQIKTSVKLGTFRFKGILRHKSSEVPFTAKNFGIVIVDRVLSAIDLGRSRQLGTVYDIQKISLTPKPYLIDVFISNSAEEVIAKQEKIFFNDYRGGVSIY